MLKTRKNFFLAASAQELDTRAARAAFYVWNALALFLSAAGICVLCLLLGLGMHDIQIFFDYFRAPLLFVLNFLPVLAVQVLLFCLFNRQWAAFLGTGLIFITASAGDMYKLKFRGEPFLFSDLSSLDAAFGVAGNYDLTPNGRVILSILCFILGTVALLLFARGRLRPRWRVIPVLSVIVLGAGLWRFVYSSEAVYYSPSTGSGHVITGWTQQFQVSKGFIYQFIHSINDSSAAPPEGYSAEEAQELLSAYPDGDIPQDKRVNLLVFQLESFCDLNELGIGGISDEAYADYYKLMEECLQGRLVANVFGGGTLDTERCFLSGSSRLLDYSGPAYSHVWYLRDQGYSTIGGHPNHKNFYNRVNNNTYLGFEDYWFLDDRYSAVEQLKDPWLCDKILFPEATEEFLRRVSAGESVFSFNVTMQGHGPYVEDSLVYDDELWRGEGYSQAAYNILNNYLGSVRETSVYLLETVDRLRAESEPIMLLAYGDHKPALGDEEKVYKELGINLIPSTEQGFMNRYSTPYFIWANDAAKAVIGDRLDSYAEMPTVSPGALMPLMFELLGWGGSAYCQLSRDVFAAVPVINSNGLYFENGRFCTELSPEAAGAVKDLRIAEYYLLNNFNQK